MHPSQSDRQMPKHLDKVLFGAAGVYFLLALMWAFHYLSEQKQPKTEKYSPNPADTEFIAYLQQSLNVINQPSREKTLYPSHPTPFTPTPEKVIERIYVPMYPPNQSKTAPPSLQPPSTPSNNLPPAPPLPPPTAVSTPQQNTVSVPPEIAANPQLPRNTGHQLVGVLESGERSTAIFTFNGMSRRFEIGEAVGSSGGILMGVQNQQAVIYHKGQTKYVDVGQGF